MHIKEEEEEGFKVKKKKECRFLIDFKTKLLYQISKEANLTQLKLTLSKVT